MIVSTAVLDALVGVTANAVVRKFRSISHASSPTVPYLDGLRRVIFIMQF